MMDVEQEQRIQLTLHYSAIREFFFLDGKNSNYNCLPFLVKY